MAVCSIKLSCQATMDLWNLLQAFLETPLPCAIISVFSSSWIDFTVSASGITLFYSDEIIIFSSTSQPSVLVDLFFSLVGKQQHTWFCWFALPLLYFHASFFMWCSLKTAYIYFFMAVLWHLEDFDSLFNSIFLTKVRLFLIRKAYQEPEYSEPRSCASHQQLIKTSCCFWPWAQEWKMLIANICVKSVNISQTAVHVRDHILLNIPCSQGPASALALDQLRGLNNFFWFCPVPLPRGCHHLSFPAGCRSSSSAVGRWTGTLKLMRLSFEWVFCNPNAAIILVWVALLLLTLVLWPCSPTSEGQKIGRNMEK